MGEQGRIQGLDRIEPRRCHYLDDARLPVLTLALKSAYAVAPGDGWEMIAHQGGGFACHTQYLLCKILKPKEEIAPRMEELSGKWLDSQAGALGVSLDEVIEYRADIQRLFGADCQHSYLDFMEGIYPLDCSREIIEKLTDEQLPMDLDSMISWGSKVERVLGTIGRWNLYILGENSD